MSFSFNDKVEEDLAERIDHDIEERILFEAIMLAHDFYGRYSIITHPPQRTPSFIELEAAYMLNLAICYKRETDEFFYHSIG